jgi:anti-sigma factor RsiW
MRCLSDGTITQYLDHGLPEKRANKIKIHISACQKCRDRAQAIKDEIDFVNSKTGIFNPKEIPEPEDIFILPQPTKRKQGFPVFLLKPALVVSFVLAFAILLFLWISAPGNNMIPSHSIIRSIGIGDQPVQVYIIEETESNTTFVWVEKKLATKTLRHKE